MTEQVDQDVTPDDLKDRELTLKMGRFVVEYLKDCNGTQAAIRAGYSENCAAQQAYENLRKPEIAQKIQEHMDYVAASLDITAHRVLAALWENHTTADKTSDSNKALELLGKNHKLFTDNVELHGDIPPARLVVELTNQKAQTADEE